MRLFLSKPKVFISILAVLIGLALFGTSYAISAFSKTLTGIGNVDYVSEVTVTDIQISGNNKVTVRLTSIGDTQADTTYTVTLYLDQEPFATTQTVSWTSGEIPGTTKKITFDSVPLAPVTEVGVEVTR